MLSFPSCLYGLLRLLLVAALCLAPARSLFAQSPEVSDTRARLEQLRSEIGRHDDRYFRKSDPEISDAAYDALKRDYEALAERHPDLAAAVALPAFGDDRTGLFPTQRHLRPMLSLRKAYTVAELRSFHEQVVRAAGEDDSIYVIEPKYDGVAISLVYERGRLVRAVTRGNGEEGDDVTANVRALTTVPATFVGRDGESFPDRIELRAEAFVTYEQFHRANREREAAGEPPFSHPRALAAGTVKLLDPAAREGRELSLVVHGWGAWEPAALRPSSQSEFAQTVQRWGIQTVDAAAVAQGGGVLEAKVRAMGENRSRWGFPTDGVVVKLDSVAAREQVGEGASAPLWALAFKFPAEQVSTRVIGITFQVGRTGVLTPVAELEPVSIGGVTVSRATLHSIAHVRKLDLRVGDTVEVERAGEVIPRIISVVKSERAKDSQPFVVPANCPSCEGPVERSEDGLIIRCPQWECPAQRLRRLEHFVAPTAVDIPGLGPGLLEALVINGALRRPDDLYRLTADDLQRAGAPGASRRLLTAIEHSRRAELWRVIHGLGIPRVGAATARTLAEQITDLSGLLTLSGESAGGDDAHASPSLREAVTRYLSVAENRALVAGLVAAKVGVRSDTRNSVTNGSFQGQRVVFTGTLTGVTRAQAIDWVRGAGGVVTTSVTAETTLVIAGESPGATLAEAQRRGVRVIGEAEFRRLVGNAALISQP